MFFFSKDRGLETSFYFCENVIPASCQTLTVYFQFLRGVLLKKERGICVFTFCHCRHQLLIAFLLLRGDLFKFMFLFNGCWGSVVSQVTFEVTVTAAMDFAHSPIYSYVLADKEQSAC